jgi:ABC-type glycerol-3-phosphate transport system substrate-binding protein
MVNKKKTLLKLFALGMIITSLSSCVPPLWFIKDNGTSYGTRQKLVFMNLSQRGSTYYSDLADFVDSFNETEIAKSLNVYVKPEGINFWDYWDKVNLSISGGDAPDIYLHAVSTTPTRKKYLLNLTDMYKADIAAGRESLDANEMFSASQINDISRYYDGDMDAWPFSATVRVVYYNKDLFDAAGITQLPKSWADMETISEKLTVYKTPGDVTSGYDTVGYDPFLAEGQYSHQWGWLEGHSYWTYDSDNKPVPHFNDDSLKTAYTKLFNSYVRRDEQARTNLQKFNSEYTVANKNPFCAGKVGMMIQNEGLYTTLKEANVSFKYGVFEIPPEYEGGTYSNWSSSFSIECYDNKNRAGLSSEEVDQRNRGTWEFLKYLYEEKGQALISKMGFMLPSKTYYDEFINNDPIFTALTKAIEHTREAEFIDAAPAWTSDIQTYINNIYGLKMSISDAFDNCQTLMESKVQQYYGTH